MSKVTGIDGPASEALFHVLNGGEYTSMQFGILRNKKTGRYDNSGDGTTLHERQGQDVLPMCGLADRLAQSSTR